MVVGCKFADPEVVFGCNTPEKRSICSNEFFCTLTENLLLGNHNPHNRSHIQPRGIPILRTNFSILSTKGLRWVGQNEGTKRIKKKLTP